MRELTKEEALKLWDSKFWEQLSFKERAEFQLFTRRLCMPIDVFHEAVEETLGRAVWTHEFASIKNLQEEFLGQRTKPTMEEIINLIPEEKRIIVIVK